MKYLAFFIVLFSLTAGFAQAVSINDCEADTLRCSCPPSIDSDFFNQSNLTEAVCKDRCQYHADRPTSAIVTPDRYRLQCVVGGVATGIAEGALGGSPSYCDANSMRCSCPPTVPYTDIDQSTIRSGADCKIRCDALIGAQSPAERYLDGGPEGHSLTCTADGKLLVLSGMLPTYYNDYYPPSTTPPIQEERKARDPIIPNLSIDIPGLSRDAFSVTQENGKTSTNFIAIYVKAIYQLLLSLSAFIAVIVFVTAGLQWLLAGGNSGAISSAKTRMQEAVLGIVLIFSAYMIGYILDPRVLDMNFLSIKSIEPIEYDNESWDFTPRSDIPGGAVQVEGSPGLVIQTNNGEAILLPQALDSLTVAANDFKVQTGGTARLTSASRTVRRQAELFYDNCLKNLGQACEIITCNPTDAGTVIEGNSSGYRFTGILAGKTDKEQIIQILTSLGKEGNCPHTSKIAVDLWCGTGGQSGYDPRCQQKLTEVMANNGWCRLNQEPWHFEYHAYALSKSSCSMTATPRYYRNGQWHDPGSCTDWNYKNNACN